MRPFQCRECGKKLTFAQAQVAADEGCPKCGGADICLALS